MNIKQIKKDFPCISGMLCKKQPNRNETIFLFKTKKTKNGWFKVIDKNSLTDYASICAMRNGFFDSIVIDNGPNLREHTTLYKLIDSFKKEEGTSPLKKKLIRWRNKVNKNQLYDFVQIGVQNDSLYVLGGIYHIVYLGMLLAVIHTEPQEMWMEDTYVLKELFDKTPFGKRKEKEFGTLKEALNYLENLIEKINKRIYK